MISNFVCGAVNLRVELAYDVFVSRHAFFFFLMIRRPPRSTLFPHDALPISDRLAGCGCELPSRPPAAPRFGGLKAGGDRKSTRLNSSHDQSSYAVFCLK